MDREGARETEAEGEEEFGERTRAKATTGEARDHAGTTERRREGGVEGVIEVGLEWEVGEVVSM